MNLTGKILAGVILALCNYLKGRRIFVEIGSLSAPSQDLSSKSFPMCSQGSLNLLSTRQTSNEEVYRGSLFWFHIRIPLRSPHRSWKHMQSPALASAQPELGRRTVVGKPASPLSRQPNFTDREGKGRLAWRLQMHQQRVKWTSVRNLWTLKRFLFFPLVFSRLGGTVSLKPGLSTQ